MSAKEAKKRLGRGLAALIGEGNLNFVESSSENPTAIEKIEGVNLINIENISVNPRNPRRFFSSDELEDLASSLREHGVIQPLLVRPLAENKYQLIAGERRWRAAKKANIKQVPVVIRDVDDKQALELAIIENVQRSDLNAIEEALGYNQLLEEYNYTQKELAHTLGKSRTYITNSLRLLKLPQKVQELLAEGKISAGHARALIGHADAEAIANKIILKNLSVRQVETLTQQSAAKTPPKKEMEVNEEVKTLEALLHKATQMKVTVKHKKTKGSLTIHYSSLEDLDKLCQILQQGV